MYALCSQKKEPESWRRGSIPLDEHRANYQTSAANDKEGLPDSRNMSRETDNGMPDRLHGKPNHEQPAKPHKRGENPTH